MHTDEIKNLEDLITKASVAYYAGEPILDDDAFDALWARLEALAPDSPVLKLVGAEVPSPFSKVKHERPMGSLKKANSPEEIRDWWSKNVLSGEAHWSEKGDGLSVAMKFDGGVLQAAVTRGRGETGELITPNVQKMQFVPDRIEFTGLAHIRAEIMLTIDGWKTHFPPSEGKNRNPRNVAAGVSRRHSGEGCEHLMVLCTDVESPDFEFVTENEKFIWLQTFGFLTPAFGVLRSPQDVIDLHDTYHASTRKKLPYEIDGIVVRENDVRKSKDLGEVDGRPRAQIAFKFEAAKGLTTLESVVWQVGRTGIITPVAKVAPITIGGATYTSVMLNNIEYVKAFALEIGCGVEITRCNDVIPAVTAKTSSGTAPINYPLHCPCCGSAVVEDLPRVRCPNRAGCRDQAEYAVQSYLKALDVKGFGDVLITKLYDAGRIRSLVDLYYLAIPDIANLESVGEKTATKLLVDLRKKSKDVPLPKFIKALGIEGYSDGFAKKVMEKYPTLADMQAATVDGLLEVEGIGPTVAANIVNGLAAIRSHIADVLKFVTLEEYVPVVGGPLAGKSFCFTGFRDAAAESEIMTKGGKIASGVSKKTTYLVCQDKTSNSGKAKKARDAGVIILSPEDLASLLKDATT